MPGLRGYALQQEIDTEIVSAYAASRDTFPSVLSGEGWFIVGAFYLWKTVATRLEILAALSHTSLAGTARLIDPTTGDPISGSQVAFTGQSTAVFRSGSFELLGGKQYWIAAQAVGSVGSDRFGLISTASLIGP